MNAVLAPFAPPETDTKAGSNGARPVMLTTEEVTITPEMARDMVMRNSSNRPLRVSRVARFARDMKAGKWMLNGETVKIATDESILDGQHRLYACIESGVPFRVILIRGLPPEAQDTIDTGAARTMADQFGLHGEKHAPLLAAITRWSWKWLRGIRATGAAELDPTHAEMIAFLEAEPRLREAAAWAEMARKHPPSVGGSVWGMAWMLFHGSDHLTAEVFLHRAMTGEDCKAGDPALAFRNRIISARSEKQRLNQYEQLGYLIMAWNGFKEDRKMSRLQPPRGGKFTPKTFPEPK